MVKFINNYNFTYHVRLWINLWFIKTVKAKTGKGKKKKMQMRLKLQMEKFEMIKKS